MKKAFFCWFIVILFVFYVATPAFAHSGRLDSHGGHNKTSDGTYHYHSGDDRAIEYSTPQNQSKPTPAPTPTPTPTPIPVPVAPAVSGLTATGIAAAVMVNGENVAFDAYNIGGNNYFKLRDLAYTLNGSAKQFDVGFDSAANAISLTSGQAYTPNGSEMTAKGTGDKTPTATTSKILLDGKEVQFAAYNIEGSNYFKLRDLGQALNFGVDWDGTKNIIIIDTNKDYAAEGDAIAGTVAPGMPTVEDGKKEVTFKNLTFKCDSRYGISAGSDSITITFKEGASMLTIAAMENPAELSEFDDDFILETVTMGITSELPTLKNRQEEWSKTTSNHLSKVIGGITTISEKETLIIIVAFADTDYIYSLILANNELKNDIPTNEFNGILDTMTFAKPPRP